MGKDARKPGIAPSSSTSSGDDLDLDTYRRMAETLRRNREALADQHQRVADTRRRWEPSREEYGELFEVSPLPTLVLDANGGIVRPNNAARVLLGLSRNQLSLGPFLLFVAQRDRRAFLDHMRRCRQTTDACSTELLLRAATGLDVPAELSIQSLRARAGSEPLYLATVRDLRERLRIEMDRRRALEKHRQSEEERERAGAANAAKDRFLAMLSHELRAPLTPVLLASSTWKDHPSVPPQVRNALAMIHRNAEVEARLIDDLLDLTRITRSKLQLELEPVEIHTVVDEALDCVRPDAERAQVQLRVTLDARRNARGDRVRVRQILTNLVRNAIRFTPAGGTVTIATCDGRNGMVEMSVSDTGLGFDADTHARMFEPFDQGPRHDRAGLGLGLAICKGLVEAQGGTIAATSLGIGRGARFEVRLPATATPAESPHGPVPAGAFVHHGPLTILLVEDHEDTGRALSYVLEHEGYRVEFAQSVTEALARADRVQIDLVVSDLGLPDGSGLDLMRALRAKRPLRGIALTGYGRREDVDGTLDAGFDRHLTKPVDVPTLVATIESLRDSIR